MVPIERILEEMERQMREARNASGEAQRREALAAVRSLVDVALGDRPVSRMPEVKPVPLSVPHATMPNKQGTAQAAPVAPPRQEEDGANGHSIFDF